MRQAIERRRVTIAPGERYDVVIDFTGFAGKEITMTNAGPGGVFVGFATPRASVTNNPDDTPFGFGAPANPTSTGLVMRFRVGKKRSFLPNATVQPGTILGEPMEDLIATKTRGSWPTRAATTYNRATEFLGSMEHGTAEWHEKATEVVKLGDTEVWEFYNLSPVAHPVHIHLVDFQVIGRQPIDFRGRARTSSRSARHVQRPARRRAGASRAARRRSASSGRRRSTSGARRTRSSPTRTRSPRRRHASTSRASTSGTATSSTTRTTR